MRVRTDAKRRQILDLARMIFLRDGYAATSMSTIAAALGGSKSTLYGYFASKEALFSEVVHSVGEEHVVPAFAVLDAGGCPREALAHLARALIRFLLMPEAIACFRLVVAEAGRFPELGRAFYDSGPGCGEARIATFLEQQILAGRLHAADPRRLAQHFCRLCEIGPHKALLCGTVAEMPPGLVEELAEFVVDSFLRAHATPALAAPIELRPGGRGLPPGRLDLPAATGPRAA